MVDRMLKPAEDDEVGRMIDDSYEDKRVRVGTSVERIIAVADPDPFAKEAGHFKTLNGLSATTKKRATRFEKSHTGSNGATSKKEEGQGYLTGYDVLGVVEPPFNLSYLVKLYEASSAHYAAVNAKTANIVGLGFDFIESSKSKEKIDSIDTEEEKQKVSKKLRKWRQSLFDWLDDCHDEDEFLETLRKVYIDYEVTGNGYFEIGRAKDGSVGYIGHIPAVSMRVRQKRDGFVQISSDKSVFFKHFGKDTVDPIGTGIPNEVIHFKKYSPSSSFYGVPDIIAATQAVAGIEFAARFNLDYFENKAVPRYVIVIKGGKLDSSSATSIVDFFETGLRGKNHRTLFVPLPADEPDKKASFEMKPVEAGTQDASFVNYNKINLQSIFMAHRVPMGKTGYIDGTALAASRDADKTFKESVCRPEQSVLEKKFGRVVKERTDAFYFKLTELTLTDEDTQSKIDERAIRNQWAVPNEIRARKGQSALKGGDTIVDFKAQAAAGGNANGGSGTNTQANEIATAATGGRARDRARSAGATDSAGQGRNTKGTGRATN